MSESWRPAPSGGPAPAGGAQRNAGVASAVIGLVALLAVLGITLFSSDKSEGASFLRGGSQGGGQGGGGTSTGQGAGGSSTGASQGAGGGPTAAQLKAHFPLPPGATLSTLDITPAPNETDYQVRGSLAAVKSFYDTRLRAMGIQWPDPQQTTGGTSTNPPRVDGWHGAFHVPGNPPVVGYLSLDDNYLGDQPGIVRIAVTID
jgi:hypothetical protein